MDSLILSKVKQLRQELHAMAEPSGQEIKTKQHLINFLQANSQLEIVDKKTWFYAIKRVAKPSESIVFRADFDAIIGENGLAFHGCGHDGHSAILAGLALSLAPTKLAKNIIFLFQHAEETGQGASECCEIFNLEKVDRVYGLHNYSGFAQGLVKTRAGVFFCASKGLNIQVTGKQSHASEPEKGYNPAYFIGELISYLQPLANFQGWQTNSWAELNFRGMVLCTIINVKIGEKAFGVSPANGEISLTIRAAEQDDLTQLEQRIRDYCVQQSKKYALTVNFSQQDCFPSTVNNAEYVQHLASLLQQHNIPIVADAEPIRSSEDFGYYTQNKPGVFLLVGNGEKHPSIHASNFEFNDAIIARCVEIFNLLAHSEPLK